MLERKVTGWFTMNGKHIPIFEGESKKDALNRSIAKANEDRKQVDIQRNKDEAKKLNAIKVEKSKESSTTQTQSMHKKAIADLSDSKYEDGTYDIKTKTTKSFPSGYQFTFCQIGDDYSDEDYAKKVNECLNMSSDGKTYAGKFEGSPEISFHCDSLSKAFRYAKANNQKSIWDWKANQKALAYDEAHPEPRTQEEKDMSAFLWMICEIDTGGTGERRKDK